jgi:hypothetical protein
MRELIDRVVKATGLEPKRAEHAIGITLSLINKRGDRQKVKELFAMLPGADKLAAKHTKDAGRKTGVLGALGGLMGETFTAVSALQGAGLTMEQIKALGAEILGYAKEKAGTKLVREVAGSIPGLSRYV